MAPETAITKESSDRLEEIRKTLAYYFWNYPEAFSRYSSVSSKKLYGPWSSIVSHLEEGKTATPLELMGLVGKELFMELSSTTNVSGMMGNEVRYLRELWYDYFAQSAGKKGIDDEKLEFMVKVKEALNKFSAKETGNIDECVELFEDTKKQIQVRGTLGVPVIHDELNAISMGGIIPGSIWVIGGFSGSGKSKLTYSMVPDLLDRGFKVAYFTLEIPKEFLLAHVVASKLGKPSDSMFKSSWTPDMWPEIRNLSVYSNVSDAGSIAQTIREGGYDFAFIDHLQLVKGQGESKVVEQENAAGKLLSVAIETKCSLICVSQISVATRAEAGEYQNLKGSGAFRENSSLIAMVNKEKDGSGTTLTISKNRYGPSGMKYQIGGDWASGRLTVKKDCFQ